MFRVAWLHVTVMPGCNCIETIREFVREFDRPGGIRMKSQEINDRDEWMLLLEAVPDADASGGEGVDPAGKDAEVEGGGAAWFASAFR